MRILQVVGHAAGGIGVHVRDLVTGLTGAGERVEVVAPSDTAQRFGFADAAVRAWPQWSRPVEADQAMRRLRSLVDTADVVHAHGHQAGLAAVLAAFGGAVPVVVSWHNTAPTGGVGGVVAGLGERLQVRRASMVTGASQDLVERARELGAARAELAPVAAPAAGSWRGTRQEARAAVARVLGLSSAGDGEVWALTVSRMAPQKDLPVLAAAARRLASEPALRWIVVGDGEESVRADLAARTARLPVHLVGARDDVATFMAAADLLVVPSRWEARALVVQEALAAGLPVVATDVGGLPELVTGCGLLVPVGDDAALAAAVAHLVHDGARRLELGALARERFTQLPTSPDVTAAWRARYAALTGGAQETC